MIYIHNPTHNNFLGGVWFPSFQQYLQEKGKNVIIMNMKLVRTVKLKLNILVESIKPTLDAYTKAFNFVCQIGN